MTWSFYVQTLLLDCDGVICDCVAEVHKLAQLMFQRLLPQPDKWESYSFGVSMGLSIEEEKLFNEIARIDPFPLNIKLYPGADHMIERLKKVYDVVFVTQPWRGNPHWVPARDRLLEPFGCDVIYTGAKQRVIGDILVDDKAGHIQKNNMRRSILFARPWNRQYRSGNQVISSLEELL